MPITKWTPVTVDRRSCILIPPEIKKQIGVDAGTILFLRALGDNLVFVPLKHFIHKQVAEGNDHQKDAALALMINDEWKGTALVVDPPLFGINAKTNNKTTPHVDIDVIGSIPAHISVINKKGFIPIPDEIKNALKLTVGDNIMVDVRITAENEPLIALKPVIDKKSLGLFLEQKQRAHEKSMIQTQEKVVLEDKLKKLKSQIEAAEQHLLQIKKTINQQPHEVQRKLTLAEHVTKKQEAAFVMEIESRHEQTLAPGHRWENSPFGKIQVPIVDD